MRNVSRSLKKFRPSSAATSHGNSGRKLVTATHASFDDWKRHAASDRDWKKDTNSYVTLHDKPIHPGYIFREVKEGRLNENKSIDCLSNTYHHSWSKDRYKKK